LARLLIIANLEELNADLPGCGLHVGAIELEGDSDDDALCIIAGAIADNSDAQWLDL
jgi:hypothetical protein